MAKGPMRKSRFYDDCPLGLCVICAEPREYGSMYCIDCEIGYEQEIETKGLDDNVVIVYD